MLWSNNSSRQNKPFGRGSNVVGALAARAWGCYKSVIVDSLGLSIFEVVRADDILERT